MMAYGCSTNGFTRIESYEQARKHFDSVKPWNSKYNPDNERPIGSRAVKTSGYYTERFNKAMRMLDDESIAFRLYDTDCVIWHPDNTVTVEGYASMSTTAFVGYLTPQRVHHGQGRKDCDEPILQLQMVAPPKPSRTMYDPRYPDVWRDENRRWREYWASAMIVQCSRPVTLQSRGGTWLPVEPDALQPFIVPTINRKYAREVSRQYNLPTLDKTLNAIMALAKPPAEYDPQRTSGSVRFGDIMDALEQEDYIGAIRLFPRGTVTVRHRTYGTRDGIQPGFLRRLRDHIYDHEGVIERTEKRTLTPAQYRRYVTDSNRFF